MNKKYGFIEDDFDLDKFKEEFNKIVEKNYYEKHKLKFRLVYFLIMLVSVVIAFLLYGILQNYINMLSSMI